MWKKLTILAVFVALATVGVFAAKETLKGTPKQGITKQETSKKGQEQPQTQSSNYTPQNPMSTAQQPTSPTCDETCQQGRENLKIQNRLTWLTFGLVIVGFLQVILLIWTFMTVNRQTSHMVTSERAWMVPDIKVRKDNPTFGESEGKGVILTNPAWRNKGGTPAFVLEGGNAIELILQGESLSEKPLPYDPENISVWDGDGIAVSPKEGFSKFVFKQVKSPIGILDRSKVLWVHGYLKYRDAFSDTIHETRYCFLYIPGMSEFGAQAQFISDGPSAYHRAT